MMKVLHLTYGLDFGGVEKHLELIAAHSSRLVEHRFAALACGGVTAETITAFGASVKVLGIDAHARPFATFRALIRLLRRDRPDVLHCHGAEANLFGLPAGFVSRVPVRLGEEIGIPTHSPKAKAIFGIAYCAAHRVIGVSEAVRAWLVACGEVPAGKAIALYNPVSIAVITAPVRLPGEALRIGFVGRLEPIKNSLDLIKAVGLLREDGICAELFVVGEGSEREAAENLIKALSLTKQVHLLGFMKDPSSVLGRCHLYVQPSLSEGLGIAIIEALGVGLPVIATSLGGAPEIVDHGRTGWLVDDPSPASLSRAIRIAEALPGEQLAAMGRSGMHEARERFDPASYVRKVEALYVSLLRRRS